jgi:hypothetical protein
MFTLNMEYCSNIVVLAVELAADECALLLKKTQSVPHVRPHHYELSVSAQEHAPGENKKEIYLRELHVTARGPSSFSVDISPKMPDGSPNQLTVDFEIHVLLVSTADWISMPSAVVLHTTGRTAHLDSSALTARCTTPRSWATTPRRRRPESRSSGCPLP